jgi:hypothetical protein
MYSGSTLVILKHFDAWFGAHQKIDRVARTHLHKMLPDVEFPSGRQLAKFEGLDGPDGIKRKTPAQDEPWHFYDPLDPTDEKIIPIFMHNYRELVKALKAGNQTRAAFEAAWLAHGLVDGLTPAHHYPYEEELLKLRGSGIETRTTIKDKLIIPGDTLPKQVSKNWQMWGDKGLLATHFAFEWGVAVMIMPLKLSHAYPSETDKAYVLEHGVAELFKKRATQIANLGMYESFYKSGWNARLAKQVRKELVPTIINTVTLAWYAAALEAKGNK